MGKVVDRHIAAYRSELKRKIAELEGRIAESEPKVKDKPSGFRWVLVAAGVAIVLSASMIAML